MNRIAFILLLPIIAVATGPALALQAGAASCDITPDVEKYRVPMAGYGAREGKPSTGVHDRLHAKILVLAEGDTRVALVTTDLRSVTPELKDGILEQTTQLGFTRENLLLCGSHTHSGPSLYPEPFWQSQFGVYDPAIVREMSASIALALAEASQSLAPASIGFAAKQVQGFTRNRRWGYDTAARESAGETPALDPVLFVMRVDSEERRPLAVFVNFAVHPTILGAGNMQLSADWPGALQSALERVFPEAVALYSNGAEGDQSPTGARGADAFERVQDFGTRLAAEAEALAREIETRPGLPIGSIRVTPELPEMAFSESARTGRYAQMEPAARKALPSRAEIQLIRIGEAVLVGLPGEPISQVGRDVKSRLRSLGVEHPVVLGLANDYLGYILNEAEYAHGGYEVDLRSYYGPGLGKFCADVAQRAAAEVFRP